MTDSYEPGFVFVPHSRLPQLVVMNVTTDEFKHFFIVHQRLLSITAWHYENVKVLGLRDAHIQRKPQPKHVPHRREPFAHDLNRRVWHARKNFKRSRKVDLIHTLKDSVSPQKAAEL